MNGSHREERNVKFVTRVSKDRAAARVPRPACFLRSTSASGDADDDVIAVVRREGVEAGVIDAVDLHRQHVAVADGLPADAGRGEGDAPLAEEVIEGRRGVEELDAGGGAVAGDRLGDRLAAADGAGVGRNVDRYAADEDLEVDRGRGLAAGRGGAEQRVIVT